VHLQEVGALAADYASAFGARDWGRLAGEWHDLGKLQPDFQRYIRGEIEKGPPHAWLGAIHALAADPRLGLPMASAIAAHHGGLANVTADEANGQPAGNTLSDSVAQWRPQYGTFRSALPTVAALPPLPAHVNDGPADKGRVELFTRFLFSALIDADRTATARFYAKHVPALTAADLSYDDVPTLAARLDAEIDAMPPKGSPAVIALRREVLAACRAAAPQPPGRFTLTVPTGGGKTLSAMSFALNHAKAHGLRRVIVVIPYTSIIEQSSRVYAGVLDAPGRNNVIEHHSNIDEQSRSESDARGENLRKLAAENWDAPVIVTTTVQFFESLLAAHGSRCRKVHNIARSVILLDEVQTLPPQYLDTIVDVLGQLTAGYGCSVVLSTATPPALAAREGSTHQGLADVHEIMPDPSALAAAARRVRVEWRVDRPTPYAELAEDLRAHRQALAIVHRRADARALAELVGGDVLHLSAGMCPAHRVAVVREVRSRLDAGKPCRLIATQLIEAGVDVDFPVVYRALAGLDSIAQSAGRCDREGKLTDAAGSPAGRMVVFRAETDPPPGVPIKAFDSMRVLAATRAIDPFDPGDSIDFFNELYRKIGPDERRVQPLRRALAFAAVEEAFKLIDADTHPIVVPYENSELNIDGPARLDAFVRRPSRDTARALQPLIVQVRRYQLDALRAAGITTPADEFGRFDVLCEGGGGAYHHTFGLAVDAKRAPEDWVC
jgi:CRISPR-associated endonuclease/helicase Cas3